MQFETSITRLADLAFARKMMDQPLLEEEEERALTLAWKNERDEKSMHSLIRSFARLVISMSLRFRFYGLPLSDIIQEGYVGILYAADKFEPERNVRFSTYAKWWIRATMQQYVLKNWSIVKLGSTTPQKQLFFNLKRLKNQMLNVSEDFLNQESQQAIANTLKVSVQDVEEMEKRLLQNDLSLNAPIHGDANNVWENFLADEKPDPEHSAIIESDQEYRRYFLSLAMNALNENERHVVLHHRLGIKHQTLSDIGTELHLSTERIRQIEHKAFRKMRHALLQHMGQVRELL